jgi:hypothetical protein
MEIPKRKLAIKLRAYDIVAEAVERGIRLGIVSAQKFNSQPNRAQFEDAIYRSVMNTLAEVFEFNDE